MASHIGRRAAEVPRPGGEGEDGEGLAAARAGAPQGRQEGGRVVKAFHPNEAPAYLAPQVGVGAGRSAHPMAEGETPRLPVVEAHGVAGVEDLHGVDEFEVAGKYRDRRPAVGDAREGMGDVDEAALLADCERGFRKRHPARYRPREEHPHQFAFHGVDFLSYYSAWKRPAGVVVRHETGEGGGGQDLGGAQRAFEMVVVGDGKDVEAAAQAGGDDGPRRRMAIIRCRGMDMKIGFQKHSVWALLAAAAFLTACGDRAAGHLEDARRLERDYDYEDAARKYELIAVAFKRAPEAESARAGLNRCRAAMHFDKAEELIFDGAAWTAMPEIEAGRRLNPDDPRSLYLAGMAHLELGPADVAWQEFTACVMRYPASPYGYLGRGEYYRFTLRRDLAFDEFVRAYRAAGNDVRARGAAFRGLRDMALKLEKGEGPPAAYYREGMALTDRAAFDYWIGFYYLRKEPVIYDRALDFFTRAVASPAGGVYEARAYAGLAECYVFYKDIPKARECIDYALARDPANDYYYKIAFRIYKRLHLPPPHKVQK